MKTKKLKLTELSIDSFVTKINAKDKNTIAGEAIALAVSIGTRVAVTILELGVGCIVHGTVEIATEIASDQLECGKHISNFVMDPILSNPNCKGNVPGNSGQHGYCTAENHCLTINQAYC